MALSASRFTPLVIEWGFYGVGLEVQCAWDVQSIGKLGVIKVAN